MTKRSTLYVSMILLTAVSLGSLLVRTPGLTKLDKASILFWYILSMTVIITLLELLVFRRLNELIAHINNREYGASGKIITFGNDDLTRLAEAINQMRSEHQERLVQSEQIKHLYRSLVNDLPIMVQRFRTDGTITFVNSEYCKNFNKELEDLLGKNIFNLIDVLTDSKDWQLNFHKDLLSLTIEKPVCQRVYRTSHGTGYLLWITRALNDTHRITEYQTIGVDVTDQYQAIAKATSAEQEANALARSYGDSLELLNAISSCVLELSSSPLDQFEEALDTTLMKLAEQFKTCNISIGLIDGDHLNLHRTKEQPIGLPSSIELKTIDPWLSRLRAYQPIVTDSLEDELDITIANKMKSLGIGSSLIAPIGFNHTFLGLIYCCSVNERKWEPIELNSLCLLGRVIGSLLRSHTVKDNQEVHVRL